MMSRYSLSSLPVLLFGGLLWSQLSTASATELIQITAENYQQVVPQGKEVDAIIGDWVLRNDQLVAVIAQPREGRKANMTVRGVSGMLIDLTRRYHESDQLSCFYPAAGRYLFEDPTSYRCSVDEADAVALQSHSQYTGTAITLSLVGTAVAKNGTTAAVTYTLRDQQNWLEYVVELTNESAAARELPVEDSLRCDGNLFQRGSDRDTRLLYVVDQFFGQGYGFVWDVGQIKATSGRNTQLQLEEAATTPVAAGGSVRWSGKINCSQGLPGLRSWARSMQTKASTFPMQLKLQSPQGPVQHAVVEFLQAGQSLGAIESDVKGMVRTELLPGTYTAVIRSIGRDDREHAFEIDRAPHADTLSLPAASRVRGAISDGDGKPIAAKVQFLGVGETKSPDFGPDSAAYAVKNVVYCANGKFEQALDAGTYQVIVSHGPEYDALVSEIELQPGQLVPLRASLPRTVQTKGWVSADFHSHSSPSGDNVSLQLGRVLNLLAEHIEFAPCTEHNRIDTYEDDLVLLGATRALATCSGMELTGSPLPINHQNAFPLHRHEHEQDGGGPDTDADPVTQIERLALWDNAAAKVVQSNHPNIPQILGDLDLDGQPDEGFRGMLGWMDVIEVHPPQLIFSVPAADVSPTDKFDNRIFGWLQLLNLGYRIPGVVNTDSHYNFHGSGWLRNYLASSSDDPAEISIEEMIHASEHGHLIMTTGPFLETELRIVRDGKPARYGVGEDVQLTRGPANLWIRVQCPNWFDVNRVQVFANGRPVEQLNFTRQSHPELFASGNVRFEMEAMLPDFEADTHVIVATIGEGLKLGPVMGPERGELPPVAVTNPIFLDSDGDGFEPNGDDLGVPFMLPKLDE